MQDAYGSSAVAKLRGACIEEIEQIDKALATGGPAIIVAAGLPHTSIGVLQHEKFGE